MSNLSAFLHPEEVGEKEVVISERFKDENGEVVKFRIRPLSQGDNDRLIKMATTVKKDRTGEKRVFDSTLYSHAVVCEGTVFPDFRAKELCDRYGVADPLLVAPTMLLTGEFARLADEIATLSGIGSDIEAEAKN